MTNLLLETTEGIEGSGHSVEDIIFIGSEETGHRCNWSQFEVLANVTYDSGYGGQEVATDLIIVFSDGMKMWRGEYDGSEWWEFSTPFKAPETVESIATLIGGCWDSLRRINEVDNGE